MVYHRADDEPDFEVILMTQPTPEQKQHIFDLVNELKGYINEIDTIITMPLQDRKEIVDRMNDIQKELISFREEYPDA